MAFETHPPLVAPRLHRDDVPALPVSRRETTFVLLSAAALALAGSSEVAQAQAVQLVVVDVKAVEQGYRTSKLLGKSVQNDKDEKIGTLDDLIVTKSRDLFSILQVGGFLGLGGRLIAVPYESLEISDDGRKITLAGASKAALEKLPEFEYRK
jgi:sporulation protein YlmC with PRC-barrel domain